jgi:predicted GNAT family acetyltransferase
MWALTWRADPSLGDRHYAATFAHGEAFGVAMAREALVSIANSDPMAARAFAGDLADAQRAVANVVGESDACAAFADAWRERTGQAHRRGMHLRHHMLTRLEAPRAVAGTMRIAGADDRAWLIEHTLAFAREVELPDSLQQMQASAERRLARGRFRIWEADGPVAFAGWSDAGVDARIAPVYTLPAWRGRGYATALVAALVRERLDAGATHLFLMTDVANPTSNALYARVGFRPVSDEIRLDFIDPGPSA